MSSRCGKESLGSRLVGHDDVRLGAQAGDNSIVIGEVEAVVGG